MALVTPTRDTPRSSTQTSQIGRPTSYAWVEQIETLPESSQDPVSSFKALKPGYSKPPYLFDPTLPDFINDGGATGQGSPIIVYTRAFNRPADYMMLALVHFLCLNPITGTAALCLSGRLANTFNKTRFNKTKNSHCKWAWKPLAYRDPTIFSYV